MNGIFNGDDLAMMDDAASEIGIAAATSFEPDPKERLEELRLALRAENISWGELAELQDLIPYIDSGDVELLEAAGVPEFEDEGDGITLEGLALGHRYVMGNVNAYCPKCSEEQGVTVLDCDYDLDK